MRRILLYVTVSSGSRGHVLLAALPMHALVACIYLWFATAGTFRIEPGGHYYELLGDAFLAGQLHLTVTPRPELLALADPYDPAQNVPYRLHDASLYDAKYYLYWGPVPGLVHALWKGVTGSPASTMLLQVLVGLGGYLWFWLLARLLRDLAFPRVPDWSVALVALCYAIGGVGPYLQARPFIYHEALIWSSFFLLGGFYWWVRGLASERHALWQLGLAGVLFGCALGSRTILICYVMGASLVLVSGWSRAPTDRQAVRRLLAFGLPPAVTLGLLALYNQARFESPFEFGQGYQLLGIRQDAEFSLETIPFNLMAYLFLIPKFIWYFPFQYPARPPEWVITESWVLEQPMSSAPVIAPLVLLAPFAVAILRGRADGGTAAIRAFVIAGAVGAGATILLLMTWLSATGRYLQDIVPVLCMLGAIALWWRWPRRGAARARRVAFSAVPAILLSVSMIGGLSYGLANLSARDRVAYIRLAYQVDTIMALALQQLQPGLWQRTYFTPEVRDRPGGFFYVGQSTVVLPVREDEPIQALTVESFFPGEPRVEIEVDGRRVGEKVLKDGPQVFRLSEDITPDPSGRAALRLTAAKRDADLNGRLWPLRVISLGPLPPEPKMAEDQPPAQWIVTQPPLVARWAIDIDR